MADDAPRTLTCLIEGDSSLFQVNVTGRENIMVLKDLIREKCKNGVLSNVDAADLTLWKVDLASPSTKVLNNVTGKNVPGSMKLEEALDEIWEHWPATLPNPKHLDIIVELPSVLGKRSRSPNRAKPTGLAWLNELHTKIWKKEEFRSLLFRDVEVTHSDYTALQKALEKRHSDRDKPDYNGRNIDVLAVKLDYLRSLPPARFLSTKASSAKEPKASSTKASKASSADVSSSRYPDLNNDEGLGASNDEDSVTKSLFPFVLSYLDLSPLGLKENSGRFRSPLLYRKEYKYFSELIEKMPQGSGGSVIVSGQPGLGKTMYLYLRIIERLIEGRPFLYQAKGGSLYHVGEEGVDVARLSPWSSKEIIVAFVDADERNFEPDEMLLHDTVQLIVAACPRVTSEKWSKQARAVTKLAMELWSPKEFFLTGIFLDQFDLPFKWLWKSSSYFGYNPRQSFRASSSVLDFNAQKLEIESVIRGAAQRVDFVELFCGTQSGINDVSHRIFQLSSPDTTRLLSRCHFEPVSRWAFDLLLDKYEEKKSDAAADFYFTLSGFTEAAALRGHLFERQILRYLFRADYRLPIRQLSNSNEITLSGDNAIRRITFENSTFSNYVTEAVREREPVHLVPLAGNFASVDSILYNPNDGDAVLTCIQITVNLKHDISVDGLEKIQCWLQGNHLQNLCPSKKRPWRFVFVVPTRDAPKFKRQTLKGDTSKGEWAGKVHQYVLGLEEGTIFGRRSNSIVQQATASQ